MGKSKRSRTQPVWFVNPNTGDAIELDLATVTFTNARKLPC